VVQSGRLAGRGRLRGAGGGMEVRRPLRKRPACANGCNAHVSPQSPPRRTWRRDRSVHGAVICFLSRSTSLSSRSKWRRSCSM
jgi:hypothetical protein